MMAQSMAISMQWRPLRARQCCMHGDTRTCDNQCNRTAHHRGVPWRLEHNLSNWCALLPALRKPDAPALRLASRATWHDMRHTYLPGRARRVAMRAYLHACSRARTHHRCTLTQGISAPRSTSPPHRMEHVRGNATNLPLAEPSRRRRFWHGVAASTCGTAPHSRLQRALRRN